MTKPVIKLLFSFVIALSFILAGCKSDENSALPDEDQVRGVYGSGMISFSADSTRGYFAVIGKYKPSDQFAADTASQGAGGLIKDTTLYNNKIQMLFAGYLQKQDSINLTQYLLVIGLCDAAATPRIGEYSFVKNNEGSIGRNIYVYFVRTDSVHFYEIFVPKTGTLSLTLFDQTERHVRGNFEGTLWGLPPDTSMTLNISDGLFDLYLVDKFFNY
jgi:hypothetical protein